jgi:ABC-2 type transport system permease protein
MGGIVMKVLIAAYYELVKNLRDIKMHVIFVVFPIITVLILGTVIQDLFSNDIIKKIAIGYVNEDAGMVGKQFNNFLDNEEIEKRLEIKKYNDSHEGHKALKQGDISTLIYLPNDLSQKLSSENKVSIQLYGDKNTEFIENLINSFTESYNAVDAVITTGGNPSQRSFTESNLKRIFYGRDQAAPRAIDYYSVLTLLQMLVVGAVFGVFIITKNQGSDIHIRMHTLPVNRFALILGRILGSVIYLTLASVITIAGTKILYNANWSGNPLLILAVVIVFCSITVGMGILIGISIRSFSTSLVLVILLAIFFGSFSGSVSPESTNNTINFLIPNYHAKVLLFGTIHGYPKQIMIEAAFWLLGMMALIYSTAALVIGRGSYDNI